jgi:UDP-GlcNAc3NAcA epimerase
MKKILTIIGARPQFIKAAALSSVLAQSSSLKETIIHTDQHYDESMSRVFFDELKIPKPYKNLGIGSGTQGDQTGRMIMAAEKCCIEQKPQAVLVYGDTNSTLAGALAAVKLEIPVIHIEAGLRSFNMAMPEETNRILTDRISTFLFCPTAQAVLNLKKEGIPGITPCSHVCQTGDVMYDASLGFRDLARKHSRICISSGLAHEKGKYILLTCHRAENTDNAVRLKNIVTSINELSKNCKIIFPVHPRTKKALHAHGLLLSSKIITTPPLGYLDMLSLQENAGLILTDSGGMQKEAFFFGIPCVTLRDETEWVETIECGANSLAGADSSLIFKLAEQKKGNFFDPNKFSFYGKGDASIKIAEYLEKNL